MIQEPLARWKEAGKSIDQGENLDLSFTPRFRIIRKEHEEIWHINTHSYYLLKQTAIMAKLY